MTFDAIWEIVGPQGNRTKCPLHRASNLWKHASNAIQASVPGDFVEAGVWKGGMCAIMGVLADAEDKDRRVWALDSFQGMSASDPAVDGRASRRPGSQLRNFDLDDFKTTVFDMAGVSAGTVQIRPGWFNETLPAIADEIEKISVLRVDVDWYAPTKLVLEALGRKVSPGGVLIFDDYGHWPGAKRAIDEYRVAHDVTSELVQTPGPFEPGDLHNGTEFYWIV